MLKNDSNSSSHARVSRSISIGRLALVGDAQRRQVVRREFVVAHRGAHDGDRPLPDLDRVVLDPAGPRQDLLVLQLVPADLVPAVVENHEPGTRRTLVYAADEV